jgi:hypothetical protein
MLSVHLRRNHQRKLVPSRASTDADTAWVVPTAADYYPQSRSCEDSIVGHSSREAGARVLTVACYVRIVQGWERLRRGWCSRAIDSPPLRNFRSIPPVLRPKLQGTILTHAWRLPIRQQMSATPILAWCMIMGPCGDRILHASSDSCCDQPYSEAVRDAKVEQDCKII